MIVSCRRCEAQVQYPKHAHTQPWWCIEKGYICCECLGHHYGECMVSDRRLLKCKSKT